MRTGILSAADRAREKIRPTVTIGDRLKKIALAGVTLVYLGGAAGTYYTARSVIGGDHPTWRDKGAALFVGALWPVLISGKLVHDQLVSQQADTSDQVVQQCGSSA